jgi:glycosyltransferase involved in cell wall biosynthesis
MMPLTVIIPTFNREDVLRKALEAYRVQSRPELVRELIVVDDGSTDGTQEVVKIFQTRAPFQVRYLRQENKGPAAARNLGIRNTSSELLLFTDSDIIPSLTLVEEHVKWHVENPSGNVSVLGYVTWSPELNPTPFMRWYGENGALFAFRRLRHHSQITTDCFYTCNLSLKASFLRRVGGFDEEFESAAWEDIELGYRLQKAGMRLFYDREAVGYHHQAFSFAEACLKARRNKSARQVFMQKDAGRDYSRRRLSWQTGVRFRIASRFASGIAKLLHPASGILDSNVKLPSVFYRAAYWHYVNKTSE